MARIKPIRKVKGGFASIDRYVIECAAFKSLGPNSVKLLLLMACDYKGNNNGDLSATYSKYKDCFGSNQTLFNARDELERKGFIAVNCYGGMSYGGYKLPSLYALMWLPIDDFINLEKNLFRNTHLPLGKILKYFLKGDNPKYKKPNKKKKQYLSDLRNPNIICYED